MNVPLSVWYLTFYCNPRLKEAVVNKILMDGFQATAVLYGKYVEKYLYSEEVSEVDPQENDKPGMTSTSKKPRGCLNVVKEIHMADRLDDIEAITHSFSMANIKVVRYDY